MRTGRWNRRSFPPTGRPTATITGGAAHSSIRSYCAYFASCTWVCRFVSRVSLPFLDRVSTLRQMDDLRTTPDCVGVRCWLWGRTSPILARPDALLVRLATPAAGYMRINYCSARQTLLERTKTHDRRPLGNARPLHIPTPKIPTPQNHREFCKLWAGNQKKGIIWDLLSLTTVPSFRAERRRGEGRRAERRRGEAKGGAENGRRPEGADDLVELLWHFGSFSGQARNPRKAPHRRN